MQKIIFSFILILFSISSVLSQEKFTLSGYVSDQRNGENIIGVNIYCKDLKIGVTSNTYGFYSLTLPKGEYETIGGYIINQIGRIPNKNELFFLPIGQVKIIKSSSRRIEQVQIYKN